MKMSTRVDSPSLPSSDSSHQSTDQEMSVQIKLEPMDEESGSHPDSFASGQGQVWLESNVPSANQNCFVNTDADRRSLLSHSTQEQRSIDDAGISKRTEPTLDGDGSGKMCPRWNVRVKLKQEPVCDEGIGSDKDSTCRPARDDQNQCDNAVCKDKQESGTGSLQKNQLPAARPVEGLGLESTVRRLWTLHSTAAKEDKMAAVPSSSSSTSSTTTATHRKLNRLKTSGDGKGSRKGQSRAQAAMNTQEDDTVCEGTEETEVDHLPLYFQSSDAEGGQGLPSAPLPPSLNEEMEDTKLYQCNVCDEAFEDAFGLRTHIARFKHRQSSRCGVCRRVFGRCSSLTVHLRTHTDERPWKCSHCPSAFKGQSGLIYHERTHSSQKPYLCQECFSSFTDSSSLHRHKRVHSGEKPYQCAHCPMAFAAKSSWVYHTRSHTGEKHYKCDQCPAAFTRPQHLKNHMLHHTSDMPFRCKVCGQSFALRAHLVQHESKQHSGDQPYRCDVCEAAFSEPEQLQEHALDHGATFKPYKCEACPAEFLQPAQLKVHTRKHTGAGRPFKCQECGASFSNSASLWKHRKIHNGEGPFVCPQCPSSFTRAANLRRHQRSHEKPLVSDSVVAAVDKPQ